jgi:hypothetical protein
MNYYLSQVFAFDSFTLLLSMQENSQAKQEEFILCDVLSFFLFSFFFLIRSSIVHPSPVCVIINVCKSQAYRGFFFWLKDELENGSVPFFSVSFSRLEFNMKKCEYKKQYRGANV